MAPGSVSIEQVEFSFYIWSGSRRLLSAQRPLAASSSNKTTRARRGLQSAVDLTAVEDALLLAIPDLSSEQVELTTASTNTSTTEVDAK
eukprot:6062740-Prymnesium_polylepis.1